MSPGTASVKQLLLPLAPPEDEARIGERRRDTPVGLPNLLERALERSNMFRALRRVRQNKGAPGVDGMTVDELPKYLKKHWPSLRAALLAGRYQPQPVLRKEIPTPPPARTYTLAALLAEVTDDNLHHEVETAPALGDEVW